MDEVPLLELRNVEKTYEDGYRAVRGMSYKLGQGQLVGLIGPNGCGKTTMMKCINRLHDPTAGDILIDGESVLDKTPGEIARKVANVPAELRGSFGLTVFETVMLGRYPYLKNVWWEPQEDEDMVDEAHQLALPQLVGHAAHGAVPVLVGLLHVAELQQRNLIHRTSSPS